MSVQSYLYLTTNDKTLILPAVANAIQRICGISTVEFLFLEGSDEDSCRDFMGEEEYEKSLHQDELGGYVQEDKLLLVDADTAGVVDRLVSIQRAVIPSELRDDILLDRFSLTIGDREIQIDDAEYMDCRVCLLFWGYSTPPDCAGFANALAVSKEFHLLVAEIEHATGTLERHFIFG